MGQIDLSEMLLHLAPHHGSNLADLSYSWWAGWLASILGQKMMVRIHYKWAKWQNFVQR